MEKAWLLEAERKILKESLRITPKRRGLLSVFSESLVPMTVSDIIDRMNRENIFVNKTTVYRDMELFMKVGLIREVSFGGDRMYYERNGEHHHHIVCVECDHIEDVILDEEVLQSEEGRIAEESGMRVIRHALEFFGVCKSCQRKQC